MLRFKEHKGFKCIRSINDLYEMRKKLGYGNYGCVRQAIHKKSNMQVAIKIMSKKRINKNEYYSELMDNELKILEEVDHPNITKVLELLEDKLNFYVVMELITGGDLLNKVTETKSFGEK
jgi:serine/threonine protein kinase